jgi:hypothetical protein
MTHTLDVLAATALALAACMLPNIWNVALAAIAWWIP